MIKKVFVLNFNTVKPTYKHKYGPFICLSCPVRVNYLSAFYKARQTSKFNCLQNKKAKLEYHPATLGENEVMWDTSASV